MLVAGFNGKEESYHKFEGFHPLGRLAESADVAHTAIFLASNNTRLISGATFSIDSGIGVRLHDPE